MGAINKLSDRYTEAAIDDEVVVMRLDDGEFFALSGTAAAIWQLIDGRRDRAGLLEALAREYSGNEEEIAVDVDELLAQLREAGLLADD